MSVETARPRVNLCLALKVARNQLYPTLFRVKTENNCEQNEFEDCFCLLLVASPLCITVRKVDSGLENTPRQSSE